MTPQEINRFVEVLQRSKQELSQMWDSPRFSEEELLEIAKKVKNGGGSTYDYLAGLLIGPIQDFQKEQERFRKALDVLYSRVGIVLATAKEPGD